MLSPFRMRIPIREQLALLVLISALVGLTVISVATWITNQNFVLSVRASELALTASLKAAQLASNLQLMQSLVSTVSTRLIIQLALERYYGGNDTESNWTRSFDDIQAAVNGVRDGGLAMQATVSLRNESTVVVNATAPDPVELPYTYPNGTRVTLGDDSPAYPRIGFPPPLYPNFTFLCIPRNESFCEPRVESDGFVLSQDNSLLLGPYMINETFAMVSITRPIINNALNADILGWLTTCFDARLILDVITSREGLDQTGITLVLGSANSTNLFPPGVVYNEGEFDQSALNDEPVRFVLSPNDTYGRHGFRATSSLLESFRLGDFRGLAHAFKRSDMINNAGSIIRAKNEEGKEVSIGYAMAPTNIVNWVIVIEHARSEIWAPINKLRTIILGCIFGTIGAVLILAFPAAHYSSRPIRRLREATKQSVDPPGYSPEDDHLSRSSGHSDGHDEELARKEGFFATIRHWGRNRDLSREERQDLQRRWQFRIPAKVRERKHLVQDELSDLTKTFNEMTDELMMQYTKLEERVQQRTAELETSKRAAEAANESKTLFIANISHELKTPLNGIMGMCAVCMGEEDPVKVKRSLGIIYKSGDLLLNLLTDLLTFSKNQVGQYLSLDEKEFKIRDISSQILAIFDKQSRDSGIKLAVKFEGPTEANIVDGGLSDKREMGPFGTGKVRNLVLWGDQHRILQVVINLISNSLKFTPSKGSITLTIRCLGEWDQASSSRKGSFGSKHNSGRTSQPKASDSEGSVATGKNHSTANEINPYDRQFSKFHERNSSPPPGKILLFEFEVKDTGPGVPEPLQQRIFEPFVQGDLGLSKKYGGTGLGLSICAQLASLMKGHMVLQSEDSKGSTFTMQIPLRHLSSRADSTASSSLSGADPHASADDLRATLKTPDSTQSAPASTGPGPVPFETDSKPRLVGLSTPFFASTSPLEGPNSQQAAIQRVTAEATKRGDKVKVLVAEDNKTNQEVVLRMLKLEDIFDITVAEDGQEAVDLVRQSMETHNPYNLIFMDVQMPNLNGLESTRLIRQSGYTAPIVALSAYSEDVNIKECLESGMNDFISKPIRRPRLKQVLKTYCPPIPEESEEAGPSRSNSDKARVDGNSGEELADDTRNLSVVHNAASENPIIVGDVSTHDYHRGNQPKS
ncbi:putative histidine kinase HHK5p [Eremomyces bilateralis CBS 781.70]|uniref:histidine kinase n=1 Tax=Eremomyces bilateralis CBS 781.70 TaxID=1392243 RepID=A0A6G1FRN9_9PEZI|nr:putative histidine kinase HHK5p [Eremomyces bilateralis CBS 781.70]KAF1808339.1 putative histidine kinase HHK5p [Eremomyces bilateralis CBS 781.70]